MYLSLSLFLRERVPMDKRDSIILAVFVAFLRFPLLPFLRSLPSLAALLETIPFAKRGHH